MRAVSLRRALANTTKHCRELGEELSEAHQMVVECLRTYEQLAPRTKQQVQAQERRIQELEAVGASSAMARPF